MQIHHEPLVFECAGQQIVGVIEHPDDPQDIGVLIVTGGPQYRIGSHRQFVLFGRSLAASGLPTMRFDYRGMGDSGGEVVPFNRVSDDLRSAIDCFVDSTAVRKVVLWGLCDAASACMIYGSSDSRVASMVLVNPWIRTEQGLARTYIRHYYLRRFLSRAFWTKLISGRVLLRKSLSELSQNCTVATGTRGDRDELVSDAEKTKDPNSRDFRQSMLIGVEAFQGPILFLLSTNDLTASEFSDFARGSKRWQSVLMRSDVTSRKLAEMDHTFSKMEWRDQILGITLRWINTKSDV